jgi:hypothetical protein
VVFRVSCFLPRAVCRPPPASSCGLFCHNMQVIRYKLHREYLVNAVQDTAVVELRFVGLPRLMVTPVQLLMTLCLVTYGAPLDGISAGELVILLLSVKVPVRELHCQS